MQHDVRFSTVVPFEDEKYRFIYIHVGGTMTIEAEDSNTAASGIADASAKSAVSTVVMGVKGESYENFSSHFGAIVEALNNDLKGKNIALLSISFDAVTPDEASAARIKAMQNQFSASAAPAPAAAPAPNDMQKMLEQANAMAAAAAAPAAPSAAPVAPVAPAAPAAPIAPAAPQLNLMKFCGRCGNPGNGKKFCTNCGSSLIKS